jgi:protein-S-isoprenylcysteine O-methyltransferase Ste14
LRVRTLAAIAIVPMGASFYFFVFWRWFDFWRKHQVLTYTFMLGTFAALGYAVHVWRELVFAPRIDLPEWARFAGVILIVLACVLGMVADRQIGIRVRSFAPFFETHGKITLVTDGAYGIVRHPIYASGLIFQIGAFLVTGYLAIVAAWGVLFIGALWFTRQEERRLIALLADPAEYQRYRERVPALIPFI